MNELDAYADLERRLQRRVSTRVVPFAWGEAFLDDDLPTRFYSNFLLVEGDLEGVSAEDLVAAADEILGGGAVRAPARDRARRASGGSARGGLQRRRIRTRAHEVTASIVGSPIDHVRCRSRRADSPTSETSSWRRTGGRAPAHANSPCRSPTIAPSTKTRARGAVLRRPLDGEPAGHVRAVSGRRGCAGGERRHARSGSATGASLDRWCSRPSTPRARPAPTRTYIVADGDDWPKHLYERLGFDRSGRGGVPEGARGAHRPEQADPSARASANDCPSWPSSTVDRRPEPSASASIASRSSSVCRGSWWNSTRRSAPARSANVTASVVLE